MVPSEPTRHTEAAALRAKLESGAQALAADDPRRHEVLLAREAPEGEFERLRAAAPSTVGKVSPVEDRGGSLVISAVLSEDESRARLVQWAVPKVSWDEFSETLPAGSLPIGQLVRPGKAGRRGMEDAMTP